MASEKNRHTMRWNTDNRIYLKGLVAQWFMTNIRGIAIVKKMDKLIPDWRDEFINEPHDINLDNALMQRADKAHRNDEYPKEKRAIKIWEQARADAVNGKMTFPFGENLPLRPFTPREQVQPQAQAEMPLSNGVPRQVIEQIRDIGKSKDISRECGLMLEHWQSHPHFTDPKHFMKMQPDKVKGFLDDTSKGRRMPFGDNPTSRTAGMIADAFLRAHV